MKIVKVSSAGDLMHVCVYSRATRWDSDTARKIKKKYKDEAYKAINLRNSVQKLEEMVACNFTPNDYHINFKLSPGFMTLDYKKLRDYWRLFLDRVRKARKRRGVEPLKYIYVMEGLHGDKALHIHALFKAEQLDGVGMAELVESWIYGPIYDVEIKNFEHRKNIGRYLSKEPRKLGRRKVGQRIFNASYNCEKPVKINYSIHDEQMFDVPDGYKVRHHKQMESEFGAYDFYILTREGSDIDIDGWLTH